MNTFKENLCKKLECDAHEANRITILFMDAIKETLMEGNSVNLPSRMKLEVVSYKKFPRNPRSGEVSKELKEFKRVKCKISQNFFLVGNK